MHKFPPPNNGDKPQYTTCCGSGCDRIKLEMEFKVLESRVKRLRRWLKLSQTRTALCRRSLILQGVCDKEIGAIVDLEYLINVEEKAALYDKPTSNLEQSSGGAITAIAGLPD